MGSLSSCLSTTHVSDCVGVHVFWHRRHVGCRTVYVAAMAARGGRRPCGPFPPYATLQAQGNKKRLRVDKAYRPTRQVPGHKKWRRVEKAQRAAFHQAPPITNALATIKRTKKNPTSLRGFSLITSLTITYFRTGCSTIIGVKSFHGPVRDGKGWYRFTMVIRHNLYRQCSQRGSMTLNLEEVSSIYYLGSTRINNKHNAYSYLHTC